MRAPLPTRRPPMPLPPVANLGPRTPARVDPRSFPMPPERTFFDGLLNTPRPTTPEPTRQTTGFWEGLGEGVGTVIRNPAFSDAMIDIGYGLMTQPNLSKAFAAAAEAGRAAAPEREKRNERRRLRDTYSGIFAKRAKEDPRYAELSELYEQGAIPEADAFKAMLEIEGDLRVERETLQRNRANAAFIGDAQLRAAVEDGDLAFKDAYDMWQSGQKLSNDDETLVEIYDEATGRPQKGYMRGGEFVPVGGQKVATNDGLGITLGPNGEMMISQGGGVPPTMYDPTRDPEQLGKKLSEADATMLTNVREAASTAGELDGIIDGLELTLGNVGYTGPGGELYGAVDDVLGVLPGDSGSRGAARSLGMEAQLALTQKTKGAITDREMGMFKSAVPGLGQTGDGNKNIIAAMRAMSQRTQTRSSFFEEYLNANGSLNGAQAAWRTYIEANPILSKDANGQLVVNEEADPAPYLTGNASMTGAPMGGAERTATNPQTGKTIVFDQGVGAWIDPETGAPVE